MKDTSIWTDLEFIILIINLLVSFFLTHCTPCGLSISIYYLFIYFWLRVQQIESFLLVNSSKDKETRGKKKVVEQ